METTFHLILNFLNYFLSIQTNGVKYIAVKTPTSPETNMFKPIHTEVIIEKITEHIKTATIAPINIEINEQLVLQAISFLSTFWALLISAL